MERPSLFLIEAEVRSRRRRRRVGRWLVRLLILFLALVTLAAGLAAFLLGTETGSRWLLARVVHAVDESIPGSIEYDFRSGTFFGTLRVENLVVRDPAGFEVIRVGEASFDVDLPALLDGVVRLRTVRAGDIDVLARRRRDWFGLERAFREPPRPDEGPAAPAGGGWSFDLPDVALVGVRVRVEMGATDLDVGVDRLDARIAAGGGRHAVETVLWGWVRTERIAGTTWDDRVEVSGRVAAGSDRALETALDLRRGVERLRLEAGVEGERLRIEAHGGDGGIDVDRYLAGIAPDLRLGSARDAVLSAEGTVEDFTARLAVATDAGAVEASARVRRTAGRWGAGGSAVARRVVPARLGVLDAPPDLRIGARIGFEADASAPSLLANVEDLTIRGIDVPDGPYDGTVFLSTGDVAASFRSAHGVLIARGGYRRDPLAPDRREASLDVVLAPRETIGLPDGSSVTGPAGLEARAAFGAVGIETGHVAVAVDGRVGLPAAGVSCGRGWHLGLALERRDDDSLVASGGIGGGEDAWIRTPDAIVLGPLRMEGTGTREPRDAPIAVAIDSDGRARVSLYRATIGSVELPGRGARTNGPVAFEFDAVRAPNRDLEMSGAIRSDADLTLGPRSVVSGPLRAEALVRVAGGAWTLVSADLRTPGVRHERIRTGAVSASIEPREGKEDRSVLDLQVASIRSGRDLVGSIVTRLVGTTERGTGSLAIVRPGQRLTGTVKLKWEDAEDTLVVRLQGMLLQTARAGLRLRGHFRVEPDGLRVPEIALEGMGASGSIRGAMPHWRALSFDGRIDGLPVTAALDLAGLGEPAQRFVEAGRLSAAARVRGTTARPDVEFAAEATGLAGAGIRETTAHAAGTWIDGNLRVLAGARLATGGELRGELRSDRETGTTAYVQAAHVPADLLREAGLVGPGIQGELADGSILFAADEDAVETHLRLADIRIGGRPALEVTIDVECRGRVCTDRVAARGADGAAARIDGETTLVAALAAEPQRAMSAWAEAVFRQDLAFAGLTRAWAGDDAAAGWEGTAAGRIRFAGVWGEPTGRVAVRVDAVRSADHAAAPPVEVRIDAGLAQGAIRADVTAVDGRGDRMRARADWEGGLRALLRDTHGWLRPRLSAWGTLSGELAGILVGKDEPPASRVALRADYRPAGTDPSSWSARIRVEQPGLTAEPLRSAAAEIRGEGTRVRLRGTARALEREALRVEGELRLPGAAGHPDDAAPDVAAAAATLAARQADLDVSLRAEEFDVAWLPLPAAVSDVRGRVDLDVRVTGSVAAPWVEGSFGVREGAFSVASTLQRFEGIHLAGTVDSERLVLDSLAVESGGGTFRGAGRAEYADPEDVRIALQFTADDLPIVGEGMTLGRLTCETDARGTMIPGILAGEDRRVDLDITLRDCAVVLPRGRSNEVMEMGDHPDFYRIGGATAGSGDRGADGSETLAVTLVARVDVPGELWIRRQDMQFAATGGITLVAGAAAERGARVEGPVSVRRGWVDMFGRRFDVQSGEVVFAGTYPIDGNIDMRLVTRTAEATVYVDVGGTLREPEVEMSSDPPRDTSEILALLYLGRTSDLTSEEEIAIGDRAGAVAQTVVEAVGLAVFQSAMTQGMGPLTVLRVDPGAGGFSDARVRAGVSLTDGLYVEYAYQFAADDLQNAHEGRIEWMILRNFSVEGYFGDAQSGGVRLQYRAEW